MRSPGSSRNACSPNAGWSQASCPPGTARPRSSTSIAHFVVEVGEVPGFGCLGYAVQGHEQARDDLAHEILQGARCYETYWVVRWVNSMESNYRVSNSMMEACARTMRS